MSLTAGMSTLMAVKNCSRNGLPGTPCTEGHYGWKLTVTSRFGDLRTNSCANLRYLPILRSNIDDLLQITHETTVIVLLWYIEYPSLIADGLSARYCLSTPACPARLCSPNRRVPPLGHAAILVLDLDHLTHVLCAQRKKVGPPGDRRPPTHARCPRV